MTDVWREITRMDDAGWVMLSGCGVEEHRLEDGTRCDQEGLVRKRNRCDWSLRWGIKT